jgi:DNA-binding FrmR family transcriptional regulator
MQALSDQQHIERLEGRMDRFEGRMDRLEKKVDDGFTECRRELKSEITAARSEARADHRTLLSIQLTTIVAMILGFAALFLQHA